MRQPPVPARSLALVAAGVYVGLALLWELLLDPWLRTRPGSDTIGDIVFFLVSGTLLGVVVWLLADRTRVEADRAHLAEQRLGLAVEGSEAGIWEAALDADRRTIPDHFYLAPALKRIIGFESAEFPDSYEAWQERVHPADRPTLEESARRHLDGDTAMHEAIYRIRHRDGSWRWIHSRGRIMADPSSDGLRWAGIDLDVTEQKRRDERTRHSTALLESLVHCSPAALVHLDLEGRVQLWNPSAERLFGWRFEEVSGKPFPAVAEDQHDEFIENMRRLRCGGSVDIETERRHKDGHTLQMSLAAGALRDDDGCLLGYVGIFQDLSQRKRAEERLESTRQQLLRAQKLEAVGRLAGGVAHDFNNLLTVIMGETQLLTQLVAGNTERSGLENIGTAATKAAGLTRQLLAFSRQDATRPERVELRGRLEETERMLRRTLPENIELRLDPGHDSDAVWIDPVRADQILLNLCVNARDAMPDGGTLALHLDTRELGEADVGDEAEAIPGTYVALEVSDTGAGMDADTLECIFDPFFTTKPQGSGTGLGLATVYGIVQESRGFIDVSSTPGRGSAFTVFLPLHAETDGHDDDTQGRATEESPPQATVLLVEDQHLVRDLLRRLLQAAGYRVLEASTGAEALHVLERRGAEVDAVLTDLVLPGTVSGLDLAEHVRDRLPVVLMSGHTGQTDGGRRARETDIPCLHKPFTVSELRTVLEASRRRQHGLGLAEELPRTGT